MGNLEGSGCAAAYRPESGPETEISSRSHRQPPTGTQGMVGEMIGVLN